MAQGTIFDLAVMGGGLAGLVAAARATELGARVVVLERGSGDTYACNSRFAGGIYHVCYQDPKLDPAILARTALDVTRGSAESELVHTIATNAGRTMDWLRTQGARFIRGTAAWQTFVSAPPRPMSTWLDWKGRGQDVLLRTLAARIAERGGSIWTDSPVTALAMRDGKFCGVRIRRAGKDEEVAAAALVIADGGFQGNADLFRRCIGPRPDLVLQRGAGTGVGNGLEMARDAGAALTDLDRFYGHILSRDAMHNDRLWPYPQIDLVAEASIVVNREGRRFVDERMGGIYIANELARLDDPACATVVFDAPIWERAGREAQIPPNPLLEKAGGTLLRSDTIAGLAEIAGVPQDALAESISSYNASVPGDGRALPIAKPPFFAIPICAGITNTMGGIAIDGHGRVKRKDGSTIDGLYAAGSTTGGLEGGPRVAYVGGLIKAAVLGLCAGEHAAQHYRVERG